MKTKKPVRGLDNIIGVNYCRYSSHSQRDASIEQQMAASQAYARANGITIIETYADRATTGRNDERREFQRMMKDAEHGKFQCVIAWRSDRLGRNMLQAMQNEARLNSLGIFCVYVEENFDDTAAGRFAKRNMMNVNQFYSESMAENITRGLQYNAENCMVTNGQLPFGYKADSSLHYALDVPKDEIVREIFIRVSNGEPMVDIYTSLNERGILTSRGKPWTKSGFNSLLHNERYKGIYIYGDTRIENGIPRIISDELFDKVQKVLTMKKNPRGRHRSEATYLLTGKLYCGYCKKPMTGMSGRSKSGENHYYYACSNKRSNGAAACKKKPVRKEQIELAIAQFIKEQLNNPEIQNGIIEFLLACQDRYHRMPELEMAQSRQEEVKKSIKNLLNAMEAGVVTPTTKDRLMELESENAKLEEKIVSLKILSTKNYTREQIAEWFSVLQKGEIDDKQYQQQIFELFLRKAYIYDDKVRLFLDLSAFSGDEESYADMDLDAFDDCIEGEENVRIGFDLSHHAVADYVSFATAFLYPVECRLSLTPSLRLFPTNASVCGDPFLLLKRLFWLF